MVKIWGFLPVRNENVPHISTESLPRNVQNNTGKITTITYKNKNSKTQKASYRSSCVAHELKKSYLGLEAKIQILNGF